MRVVVEPGEIPVKITVVPSFCEKILAGNWVTEGPTEVIFPKFCY
jgi:hypothetical protein